MTAVCWQLELLGRSSCRPWQLLLQLGRQLAQDDYVIMAAVKLLTANYEQNRDLLREIIKMRDVVTCCNLFKKHVRRKYQ